MKPESKTRQRPRLPWSDALAIIRPPQHQGDDLTMVLAYSDPTAALSDYDRALKWKQRHGVIGQVCSVRLEKDPDGQSWLDVGRTDILKSPRGQIRENLCERLAVQVIKGGINRPAVMSDVRRAGSIWLIVVDTPENDAASHNRFYRMLMGGNLPAMPGTTPIMVGGIYTLGKLTRPTPPPLTAQTLSPFF